MNHGILKNEITVSLILQSFLCLIPLIVIIAFLFECYACM